MQPCVDYIVGDMDGADATSHFQFSNGPLIGARRATENILREEVGVLVSPLVRKSPCSH
jgi:hypothetical protein